VVHALGRASATGRKRRSSHPVAYGFVQEASNYTRDANAYVAWVHDLERKLREFFSDVPVERLYSERFWRIAVGGGERPEEMRRQEMDAQLAWLRALLEAARTMHGRFGATTTSIAVLGTNVLLHCKPLTDIDWCALIGTQNVRLVVPLLARPRPAVLEGQLVRCWRVPRARTRAAEAI